MLDHEERDRWRAAAEEKLRTAEILRDGQRHADACVLYEQSCQLTLKGVLVGLGRHDRRHDLDELARTVSRESGQPLDERLAAALSALARDYIPARYPDAYDSGTPDTHYGQIDADRARATTSHALGWADEVWDALTQEVATEEVEDEGPDGAREEL